MNSHDRVAALAEDNLGMCSHGIFAQKFAKRLTLMPRRVM